MNALANDTEFPKTPSTLSGGDKGWTVEVRLADYKEPQELFGQMITNKWKKFEFTRILADPELNMGVPVRPSYGGSLEQFQLLPYAAAQALRWMLHAHFEASEFGANLAFESRLIEHKTEFSFKSTPTGAFAPIGGEDRSCIMPNWGNKQGKPVEVAKPIVAEPIRQEVHDAPEITPSNIRRRRFGSAITDYFNRRRKGG